MRIAVTGHRPDKLGGYRADLNFRKVRRHMRQFLWDAPEGELTLLSGGALGIDQFWIQVGLYLDLPVVAALPFEGYDAKWPAASRQEYEKLLDRCQEVRYVCEPGYSPTKLQTRNEWLVDNCDTLVAYWTGQPGGTSNCIDYAGSQGRRTVIFDLNEILS
jgi:uncharacterized phage-like protein YoqJ